MHSPVSIKDILHIQSRDAAFLHAVPSLATGLGIPILDANETASTLLGYTADELLTMPLSDIIGSHTMGADYIEILLENGHARCNSIFTSGSGAPINVDVDSHIIETEGQTVCLTVARDMSEQKKLEAKWREARSELKRANMAKHQFLANMSHELRTPLNGFLGMTQILMSTDLTPAQREYLSLSQDAARQLTKVLTDMLSLSSVETGNLETLKTSFEIHPVLEGLVAPMSRQAADKSLILSLNISPEVPRRIRGDCSKLRQILVNLLFNAIHFTESGEVSLSVSLADKPETSDSCTLAFTVADTGIGIPEGKQAAIFDSFSLGEDYLTKEYGGAGLGLSISKQLAEVMNGKINVESTPGIGSEFTLILPFQIAVETPVAETETNPLSILLAEDEQVNSIMASRLLKKAGHNVSIVGNGQNAIEALMKNNFDLVFMDVQMPVINGMEVTQIIRRGAVEGVRKDIPVIGLTAYAGDADRKRFLEAGMNSVVTKPFEMADLINAIHTATA